MSYNVMRYGHTVPEEFRILQWDQPPIFFFSETSPYSNFYRRDFVVKGIHFDHMEKFIMFCKAMTFGDKRMAEKILTARSPMDCKKLGREVAGFDEAVWRPKIWNYGFEGMKAKYGQHRDLLSHLLSTNRRELVEASPYDSLWGIGMAADDPNIWDRSRWGENFQGHLTMRTRTFFQTGW